MINLGKLKQSIKIPKRTLNVLIILATLSAAVYYFYHHRKLLTNLRHISVFLGFEVFGLYLVMLVVLIAIYWATMKLVNIEMPLKPNSLINIYSLFMNFFIPGQSGPAYRAYYMKKNYNLKYLDFTLATLTYYLIYGVLSVIFIVVGSQRYFISLPVVIVVVAVAALGLKFYLKRQKQNRLNLSIKNVLILSLVTLGQVILWSLIFFVELHSFRSGLKFSQVITYAGTANLALFVALTPGAIGIREGFLILSERLNHFTSSTIVLANVIDRSVYIIFLLILGLGIGLFHVKTRLSRPVEARAS